LKVIVPTPSCTSHRMFSYVIASPVVVRDRGS
jgi:hypothetical protein